MVRFVERMMRTENPHSHHVIDLALNTHMIFCQLVSKFTECRLQILLKVTQYIFVFNTMYHVVKLSFAVFFPGLAPFHHQIDC